MEKELDLVVVGEFNADLILSGDVLPAFGQVEKLVDDASLTIGSSAAICANGAARLGLRTALIGKRGDDPFGNFVDAALRQNGVDTAGVVVDPDVKTGLSVILNRGSDRAILTHPGSISLMQYDEIDLSLIRRARHLHLASYYMLDALRADVPVLFRLARQNGLTVSLDCNYDPRTSWQGGIAEALALTELFFPNETELLAISGERNIPAALARLARPGLTIVVKQGAAGATAWNEGQTYHSSSIAVEPVDTVGAGDSFDAGYLYAFIQGWAPAPSLAFACICGALSTRAAGGTNAQPDLEQALSMLEGR